MYTTIEVCQRYEGYHFCDSVEGYSYGDGNWMVYVDRSPSKWGPLGLDSVDLYLVNLLPQLVAMDIGDKTWTPGCQHAVRQLLCYVTLPFCKKQGEQGKRGRGEAGNLSEGGRRDLRIQRYSESLPIHFLQN